MTGFQLSTLPDEIILAIIQELTDDTDTLKCLCEAVQDNVKLLIPALKTRWRKVTIDHRDLLPDPRERSFEHIQQLLRRYGLDKKWPPVGHGVQALLEEIKPNLWPANYVRDLIIDMRILRYLAPEVNLSVLQAEELMPTLASFEYSFALIEPHFHSIRSLSWDGDLPQSGIELITGSKHFQNIQSLTLQQQHGPGRLACFQPAKARGDPEFRSPVKLDSLQHLSKLKVLGIHRLAIKEVPSLLSSLPYLSQLETLVIADEEHDSKFENDSAINRFVLQLLSIQDYESHKDLQATKLEGLPPSLNSLTLIETSYAQARPAQQVIHSTTQRSPLSTLTIVTEGNEIMSQFAMSFTQARLKDLTLPGPAFDISDERHSGNLQSLISMHAETLERVSFGDAWGLEDNFSNRFNEQWAGKFEIQELVLGTVGPSWLSIPPEDLLQASSPALQRYLDGYDAYEPEGPAKPDLWGDNLQRIRIDDTKSLTLTTSILGNPRFSKLKIIMLQAFDNGSIPDVKPSASSWGCQHIDEPSARSLARQIQSAAAASLRVIVIQNYWWWVDHSVDKLPENGLWTWAQAENDLYQAKLMKDTMLEKDWLFLQETVPRFWNARFRSKVKSPLDSISSGDTAVVVGRRWNRLTAVRVGK